MSTTTTSPQPLVTADGRGSIVRPRFAPGLLLLDEDMTAGVDYTRALTRLLFRNLFGCGVICGLTVDGQEAPQRCLTITVQPGLALDCQGDPVQVRQAESLTIKADCDKTLPSSVVVAVRHRQHHCMPRELVCPPDPGGHSAVKTRTIDCFEIAVFASMPPDACGCAPTPPAPPPPPAPPTTPTVSGAAGGVVLEGSPLVPVNADHATQQQRIISAVFQRAGSK